MYSVCTCREIRLCIPVWGRGEGTEACSFVTQVSLIPSPLRVISLHTLKCLEAGMKHTHIHSNIHYLSVYEQYHLFDIHFISMDKYFLSRKQCLWLFCPPFPQNRGFKSLPGGSCWHCCSGFPASCSEPCFSINPFLLRVSVFDLWGASVFPLFPYFWIQFLGIEEVLTKSVLKGFGHILLFSVPFKVHCTLQSLLTLIKQSQISN